MSSNFLSAAFLENAFAITSLSGVVIATFTADNGRGVKLTANAGHVVTAS